MEKSIYFQIAAICPRADMSKGRIYTGDDATIQMSLTSQILRQFPA